MRIVAASFPTACANQKQMLPPCTRQGRRVNGRHSNGNVSRRHGQSLRGILGMDLRCMRRSGRICVGSVSPSWFYVTATRGTGPKAGEKNSSPLEWLSIKLWLRVHWGDSLKEMCARSVVVCCSRHP